MNTATVQSGRVRSRLVIPDTARSKSAGQLAFGPAPPADLLPFRIGQHHFGRGGNAVGHVVFAAPAGRSFREDQSDVRPIDILAPRYADRPEQATLAQSPAERPARPPSTARLRQALRINCAGIGQHAAEAGARGDNTINLLDGDLRLCQGDLALLGNPGAVHAPGITRPALGQEQAQTHHHRHFARRQRHRNERLAVGGLAKRRGVLRRHPDRMAAFLGQRCIVDDQKPGLVPHQTVGLLQENSLERCAFPHPVCDKMMKLVIAKPPDRHANLLPSPASHKAGSP